MALTDEQRAEARARGAASGPISERQAERLVVLLRLHEPDDVYHAKKNAEKSDTDETT